MKFWKAMSLVVSLLLMVWTPAAYAILAGCNPDIHMDIPGVTANDFHIEGRIKSGVAMGNWSQPPALVHHVDHLFPYFNYIITPDMASSTQNEYFFKADWSGATYEYCQILHLGLVFDLQCHNLIIDLVGWWTWNGKRIDTGSINVNQGAVLLPGFMVNDIVASAGQQEADGDGGPQKIRVQNDSGKGQGQNRGIQGLVMQMDLAKFSHEEVVERFGSLVGLFDILQRGDPMQEKLQWVPVLKGADPVSPDNPQDFAPDSFFDVFLEIDPTPGQGLIPATPMPIQPGEVLVSRVKTQYLENDGKPAWRWTWHLHEAHGMDYGDAPDPTYPTLMASNGAAHIIRGPWLGDQKDAPDGEPDGQPEPQALGDDLWNGNDDEDGVIIPVLTPGQPAVIQVQVNGGGGVVDGWIDFNLNGSWEDPQERVIGAFLPNGIHPIAINVPTGGPAGQTFARFRISWQGGLMPKGKADNGEVEDHLVVIEEQIPEPENDLGDAPDSTNSVGVGMTAYPGVPANYPTVYVAGSPPHGPWHLAPMALAWLGQGVSLEKEADIGPDQDGVNNILPQTDAPDRDKLDDGVIFPIRVRHCAYSRMQYLVNVVGLTTTPLYANVWFDWNHDGDWDDTLTCTDGTVVNEWGVQNQQLFLPLGLNTVTSPPFAAWLNPDTDLQSIWMRITLSERKWTGAAGVGPGYGGSGPAGGYKIGETEDYLFLPELIPPPDKYDFGDAPDKVDPTGAAVAGYHTLLINDGARHKLGGGLVLGAKVDAENDGQQSPDAQGDDTYDGNDDEDGVQFVTWPLVPGRPAVVEVTCSQAGKLSAWIDFDGDGTWQQPGDRIFADASVSSGLNALTFMVPLGAQAPQHTFARFRVSSNGGLSYRGEAPDGEVEDYPVKIQRRYGIKWLQLPDTSPFGIDICLDNNDNHQRAIADDFLCTEISRITDIHLWGSWKKDVKGVIRSVRLRIYSDDPVGPGGSDPANRYSKPDKLLWQRVVSPNEMREKVYARLDKPEYWWDPLTQELIPAGDKVIWQIDIRIPPKEALLQDGTPKEPVIYWLEVQADSLDGDFGWKTRRWPRHFKDDAVMLTESGVWKELRYPASHPYYHLTFDDLMAGTVYQVGDTFITAGQAVDVKPFQYNGGLWTSKGEVVVDTANRAGGSGLDIWCNNASVHFNAPPLDYAELLYGEFGGNVNLAINGDLRNANDLIDLDGAVIGGVAVSVLPGSAGVLGQGILRLEGAIADLTIGGQEFWLDNTGSSSIDMAFAITDRAFTLGSADLDASGMVDLEDFRILATEWLTWPE